jgi:hypothetical protein
VRYRLPDGFPNHLSEKELDNVLTQMSIALRQNYGDAVGKWLPELQLAILNTALSELARRELATSGKIAYRSLIVAGLALLVAIITLIVALSTG